MNRKVFLFLLLTSGVAGAFSAAGSASSFSFCGKAAPVLPADTPEKIADPEALTAAIPRLKETRDWKDFASSKEIALFDGPEKVWETPEVSDYDLSGFNSALLGSKVPAPGVHPRVFFNYEDLPMLRKHIESTPMGQKMLIQNRFLLDRTIYKPGTAENRMFELLKAGKTENLKFPDDELDKKTFMFKGFKPTLRTTIHNGYFPYLLQAAQFQALLDGDEKRSAELAAVAVNYWKLRKPLIDKFIAENEKNHTIPAYFWRGKHQIVAADNLGMNYDLGARFMSEDDRKFMRSLISEVTKGGRAYGMNGPARWAETNWVGWDMSFLVTLMSIEGEDGFDPDARDAAERTLKGYLDWGFSPAGTIFETNGKNGAGLQYALEAMIILARRGKNYFGHPYFKKNMVMQAQSLTPAGDWSLNNGTWGCAKTNFAAPMINFYPGDKVAGLVLANQYAGMKNFDPVKFKDELNRMKPNQVARLEFLTAGALGMTPYYCAVPDFSLDRKNTDMPLDYTDNRHGLLYARSSNSPDAVFMMVEARPDFSTVGHQHFDAGHFYLAGNGKIWAVENGPKMNNASAHNTVLIDNLGYADISAAPKVRVLKLESTPDAAQLMSDVSNAYNFGWTNPAHYSWTLPEAKDWKLSVETDPEVVDVYRGTQHYRMRIWGDNEYIQPWGPMMRIAGKNPVVKAERNSILVRGKHPYMLQSEFIVKDGKDEHDYTWLLQLPKDVRLIKQKLPLPCVASAVLAAVPSGDDWRMGNEPAIPRGTPALFIASLDDDYTGVGGIGNQLRESPLPIRIVQQLRSGMHAGTTEATSRLEINRRAVNGNFKILMMPFKMGDEIPGISYDRKNNRAEIKWKNQTDVIEFSNTGSAVKIVRDGREIVRF